MVALKPFWRYYGGKFRAAPRYPTPLHSTIVEPFAGAAGYSTRYHDRRIVLIEKYPTICEIWMYLIKANPSEIRRIPEVDHVDDLPSWVPQGARYLIGFTMNSAASTPRKRLSAGRRKLRAINRQFEGWTQAMRDRVASQVEYIRHWEVIEGDCLTFDPAYMPAATYFVDPPYNNKSGSYYVHHKLDFAALGAWCRALPGQAIVCENEGADWLPFQPLGTFKAQNGRTTAEAIWTKP